MTRPQLLPNGIAHTEWVLRALDGLGLDESTMLHAAVTLMTYVRGAAMSFEAQAQAEQDTGMTDDEWMSVHEPSFAALFASGYPTLSRLTNQADIDLDLDTLFEFGLQRMLDGYTVLIQDAEGRHGTRRPQRRWRPTPIDRHRSVRAQSGISVGEELLQCPPT